MESIEPKAGDIMRLKSGGPEMTIYKIMNESYYCHWFDVEDYSQVREATFPETSLVKVEKEERAAGWSYSKAGTYRSYAP